MKRLFSAIETVAALFLLLIALLTAGNVLLRYAFSVQIPDWFDGTQMLQGIAMFWGIALATYYGTHIGVDIVWEHLGDKGRRRIDPFCEAGDRHEPRLAQFLREFTRHPHRKAAGGARADNRNAKPSQQCHITLCPQHRRRIGNFAQKRGVVWRTPDDQPRAEALSCGTLFLCRRARTHHIFFCPRSTGNLWQSLKRGRDRAVLRQQFLEGRRANPS